jgi:hypothetical protein
MSTLLCRACTSLVISLAFATYVSAKPPDLPLDLKVSFAPEQAAEAKSSGSISVRVGYQLFRGLAVEVDIKANVEETDHYALDMVSPWLHFALQQMLEAAVGTSPQPPQERTSEVSQDEFFVDIGLLRDQESGTSRTLPREDEARRMFQIAERCRRDGDLDMAYGCYRETMLICPGCRYAQDACRRARQIEDERAREELADPEQREEIRGFRDFEGSLTNYPGRFQEVRESTGRMETVTPGHSQGVLLEQARRMYLRAERARQAGNLDRAYIRFQQTHLICPDSDYGRKAMQRVHEIELKRAGERTGAAEEQEEPAPKKRKKGDPTKKLLESTEPLELFLGGFISIDEESDLVGLDKQPTLPTFLLPSRPRKLMLLNE